MRIVKFCEIFNKKIKYFNLELKRLPFYAFNHDQQSLGSKHKLIVWNGLVCNHAICGNLLLWLHNRCENHCSVRSNRIFRSTMKPNRDHRFVESKKKEWKKWNKTIHFMKWINRCNWYFERSENKVSSSVEQKRFCKDWCRIRRLVSSKEAWKMAASFWLLLFSCLTAMLWNMTSFWVWFRLQLISFSCFLLGFPFNWSHLTKFFARKCYCIKFCSFNCIQLNCSNCEIIRNKCNVLMFLRARTGFAFQNCAQEKQQICLNPL